MQYQRPFSASSSSAGAAAAGGGGGGPPRTDTLLLPFYQAVLRMNIDIDPSSQIQVTNASSSTSSSCHFSTVQAYTDYFFPLLLQECRADIRKSAEMSTADPSRVKLKEVKEGRDFDFVTFEMVGGEEEEVGGGGGGARGGGGELEDGEIPSEEVRSNNNNNHNHHNNNNNGRRGRDRRGGGREGGDGGYQVDGNDLVQIIIRTKGRNANSSNNRDDASHDIVLKGLALAIGSTDLSRRAGGTFRCRILPSRSSGQGQQRMEAIRRLASSPSSGSVSVLRLTSLSTTAREYLALQSVGELGLRDAILSGNIRRGCYVDSLSHLSSLFQDYLTTVLNPCQLAAVQCICAQNAPMISMVQGPPGTGKSQTLLSILNVFLLSQFHRHYETSLAHLDAIFRQRKMDNALSSTTTSSSSSSSSSSEIDKLRSSYLQFSHRSSLTSNITVSRPHILVCAPSNAAVDELVARVMRDGYKDANLRTYVPHVVRIGSGHVSDRVREVTLDELVARQMRVGRAECEAEIKNAGNSAQALSDKIRQVLAEAKQAYSESLPLQAYEVTLAADLDRREAALTTMKRHQIVLEGLKDRSEKTAEQVRDQLRASFLDSAQVVFTTLSSAGLDCFRLLSHGFQTVIIDEAAQAVELSCLIPLLYGCDRLVLVGDPAQLPATVISRSERYARSLFERLMKVDERKVFFLNTQYRMHSSIRSFPALFFYDNRLEDSAAIKGGARNAPFHNDQHLRGAFLFLDLGWSQMHRSSSSLSLSNRHEAVVVANLVRYLQHMYGTDLRTRSVAVLTPYRQQLKELERAISLVCGDFAKKVVVATVDSFQGQEADIVLFSSVRAGGSASVGFLSDIRRMNVALTRARYALYIIGTASALESCPPWLALIESAKASGAFVDASKCPFWIPPEETGAVRRRGGRGGEEKGEVQNQQNQQQQQPSSYSEYMTLNRNKDSSRKDHSAAAAASADSTVNNKKLESDDIPPPLPKVTELQPPPLPSAPAPPVPALLPPSARARAGVVNDRPVAPVSTTSTVQALKPLLPIPSPSSTLPSSSSSPLLSDKMDDDDDKNKEEEPVTRVENMFATARVGGGAAPRLAVRPKPGAATTTTTTTTKIISASSALAPGTTTTISSAMKKTIPTTTATNVGEEKKKLVGILKTKPTTTTTGGSASAASATAAPKVIKTSDIAKTMMTSSGMKDARPSVGAAASSSSLSASASLAKDSKRVSLSSVNFVGKDGSKTVLNGSSLAAKSPAKPDLTKSPAISKSALTALGVKPTTPSKIPITALTALGAKPTTSSSAVPISSGGVKSSAAPMATGKLLTASSHSAAIPKSSLSSKAATTPIKSSLSSSTAAAMTGVGKQKDDSNGAPKLAVRPKTAPPTISLLQSKESKPAPTLSSSSSSSAPTASAAAAAVARIKTAMDKKVVPSSTMTKVAAVAAPTNDGQKKSNEAASEISQPRKRKLIILDSDDEDEDGEIRIVDPTVATAKVASSLTIPPLASESKLKLATTAIVIPSTTMKVASEKQNSVVSPTIVRVVKGARPDPRLSKKLETEEPANPIIAPTSSSSLPMTTSQRDPRLGLGGVGGGGGVVDVSTNRLVSDPRLERRNAAAAATTTDSNTINPTNKEKTTIDNNNHDNMEDDKLPSETHMDDHWMASLDEFHVPSPRDDDFDILPPDSGDIMFEILSPVGPARQQQQPVSSPGIYYEIEHVDKRQRKEE